MDVSHVGLSGLDISLFVLTVAISVAIGIYFANKNDSMEDYMLGGRDQKLLPVALSMMTSFISGLTLIGCPAELYYHGPGFATIIISHFAWVPFSTFILLPVFHRLGHVSVNQYLELRYNASVKKIVSLVFMIQMTLYNAVVLYVPSLSLGSILGIPEVISIGAVGISCVIYSTFGGIKAVIWTDFFQAGLMFLSLLLICIGGTIEAGGFTKLIDINQAGGRLSLEGYFDKLDLKTRHTFYTITTGAVIMSVFINGANQIQVQRALTLPTLRLAQYSQLLTGLFVAIIISIASYIGLILYSSYNDCDPFENNEIEKRDAILIYYVGTHLKNLPGLKGLFVAGIFAATLSTLSSFQNSMSALFIDDFLVPIFGSKLKSDQKVSLHLSKFISLLFGLVCIGLTFAVGRVSGLHQVALTLFGALGAPLVVAFFMGMLTRFTNTKGILVGTIGGYLLGLYIEIYQTFYSSPLLPTKPISTEGCNAANITSIIDSLKDSNKESIMSELLNTDENIFDFASMSYLWLPVFEVILSVILTTIVSLLTGGWHQQVDDNYLVSWKKRPKNMYEFKNNQIIESQLSRANKFIQSK